MMYKSEEEFLKKYNKNDFDLLSVTTDNLVLSISNEENDNYWKTIKKHMSFYQHHLALVDNNLLNNNLAFNASWFNVKYFDDNDSVLVLLDNGNEQLKFKLKKVLREKTSNSYSYVIEENNDIAFNLMPEYFTLGDLQQVYEVILNK